MESISAHEKDPKGDKGEKESFPPLQLMLKLTGSAQFLED